MTPTDAPPRRPGTDLVEQVWPAPHDSVRAPTLVAAGTAGALAALALPGHDPRRYWRHVSATLFPGRGEGLREAAREWNRGAPAR